MGRIINKIIEISSAVSVCMMFCFAPIVLAEPVPATPPFDHSKTGFILRDVHTTLRCEQCHVDAIFKNTPKDCAGCHSIGSRVGATPKPVNHVQTTSSCDTCHVSPTSFLVKSFKHFGISSGCSSCHNGQSLGVMSKAVNHFPTLLPCENCHNNTNTFSSAKMDHAGITSACATCHGGQSPTVVSKPMAHIATGTADCGACHTTITFLGALFDHSTTTVAGKCNTCHGPHPGVVAQPAIHIQTLGANCDSCHTATNTSNYTSFTGAFYDHASPSSAGRCSSCHTGQYAGVLGKPVTHITTGAQCDTCHTNTANYTTFMGVVFNHSTIGTARCDSCHNGSSAIGKPAFHIPTPAGADCVTCHTSVNTANYTTFFGATYSHTAVVAGSCGTCHNGTIALGKPVSHIVTSGTCDSCHTNTANYTTWLGAIYTHSPNPPTTGSCANCHNGTTATGKPSWHMATTAACDQCHTGSNTSNYTTFLGATGADHATMSPPAAGRCAACHNGATAKGQPAGHIPTGALSCDGCHKVYNGTTVISFAPGTMDHTKVTGTSCYSCHNGSYTTQGTMGAQAMPINHIPTTITGGIGGLPCTTCHTTPGYTSATGWLAEKMNHNGAMGGGAPVYCVSCHLSGTTYLVPSSFQRKSHNGASTAKDCSSSNCHKPLGKTGTSWSNWN